MPASLIVPPHDACIPHPASIDPESDRQDDMVPEPRAAARAGDGATSSPSLGAFGVRILSLACGHVSIVRSDDHRRHRRALKKEFRCVRSYRTFVEPFGCAMAPGHERYRLWTNRSAGPRTAGKCANAFYD
ncbi:hypothetical protein [Sorangium sp. So ce1097]|uniref:hypothetical protein n=1 Tax=Sorangium sp. So ce1097 TaxID=3133330 RepID=UPI003F6453EC